MRQFVNNLRACFRFKLKIVSSGTKIKLLNSHLVSRLEAATQVLSPTLPRIQLKLLSAKESPLALRFLLFRALLLWWGSFLWLQTTC